MSHNLDQGLTSKNSLVEQMLPGDLGKILWRFG